MASLPNLSTLQQDSNDADAEYGLPIGTTYAIAGTESSYGTNLGSRGNIFQIGSDTAAKPGFNLGTLDGNDPMDAAAYLSAIGYNNPNSPGYQNLAVSYQLYQNGPNSSLSTPAQYSPNSAFAQFLAGLNSGTTSPDQTNSSAPPTTTGAAALATSLPVPASGAAADGLTPDVAAGDATAGGPIVAVAEAVAGWFPGWLRLGGGFIAVMLILLGIAALVFLSRSPAPKSA